ncbi:hypothetical protein [Burkholderia ubonensis]|uniref:hypothetical protein n=1 Tax=Burkholderia ubonensis TaxID=101571 RepID=UPI000F5AAC5B|nr:hypothetical protein [Burkholderia ubonensis]
MHSEVNALVEGEEAVNELPDTYWRKLWRYAGPDGEGSTAIEVQASGGAERKLGLRTRQALAAGDADRFAEAPTLPGDPARGVPQRRQVVHRRPVSRVRCGTPELTHTKERTVGMTNVPGSGARDIELIDVDSAGDSTQSTAPSMYSFPKSIQLMRGKHALLD